MTAEGKIDALVVTVENYVFPYGKFQGQSVGDVFLEKPDYLDWMAENSKDPVFRFCLNIYLDRQRAMHG